MDLNITQIIILAGLEILSKKSTSRQNDDEAEQRTLCVQEQT